MFPCDKEGYYCNDQDSHYVETWKAMEKLVDNGKTKTIGLSNFNKAQIVEILSIPGIKHRQSYEIKSPPWTILWFRILGIFSVENIARLGVFVFQTSDNNQLCIDSQYSSQ